MGEPMTGYRKPRVTWHTPSNQPKPRRYQGEFTLQTYDEQQAAERQAAEPALTESALMDANIRRYEQQKAEEKADEQRRQQRRIDADKRREEQNAAVLAEVAAAKVKAEQDAALNRKLEEVETGLQGYDATPEETRTIRNRLQKQQRTDHLAWILALTELRMERAEE